MRTILLSLCLFMGTILCAQNNVLAEIENANTAYKVITGDFVRTQTNVAKVTSIKADGTLYIVGEDQMAQYYNVQHPIHFYRSSFRHIGLSTELL